MRLWRVKMLRVSPSIIPRAGCHPRSPGMAEGTGWSPWNWWRKHQESMGPWLFPSKWNKSQNIDTGPVYLWCEWKRYNRSSSPKEVELGKFLIFRILTASRAAISLQNLLLLARELWMSRLWNRLMRDEREANRPSMKWDKAWIVSAAHLCDEMEAESTWNEQHIPRELVNSEATKQIIT